MNRRARIETDLRKAMAARDRVATRVLRSLLAEFDHAGAVPPDQQEPAPYPIDPTRRRRPDVPRRELSAADEQAIVRGAIEERLSAMADYERLGHGEMVRRLRTEVALIARYEEE